MRQHLNSKSPAEEAQFREDVETVFEEAGGPLTEDELIERVWHRELQRAVDSGRTVSIDAVAGRRASRPDAAVQLQGRSRPTVGSGGPVL